MDKFKVVVRVRPLIERETGSTNVVTTTDKTISINGLTYRFDQVFDENSSNDDIFVNVANNIVNSTMEGYNGSILTYGQTASGKTHTVNFLRERAVRSIFDFIKNNPERTFWVRLSYIELYNECFKDLFEDKPLVLREDSERNVFFKDVKEICLTGYQDAVEAFVKGDERRKFAETVKNQCSSRSHCIIKFNIISQIKDEEMSNCHETSKLLDSHLYLVDLAGSEKAYENVNRTRFKEGININKSLATLSLVIRSLSENEKFINYRDSNLTRFLQNALGGNSKTAIILTISPTSVEESISTLKFGQNAKKISTKPQKNEVLTAEQAEVEKLTKVIENLKNQIIELKDSKNSDEVENLRKKNEVEELSKKQQVLFDQFRSLLCDSSKMKLEKKEKIRRMTVCVPQASRVRFFEEVEISPFGVTSSSSNVDANTSAENRSQPASTEKTKAAAAIEAYTDANVSWSPSKFHDLDISFKDYEKDFIQEAAFKKLHAYISQLQKENKELREKIGHQSDILKNTEEPSFLINESFDVFDGPFVDISLDEKLEQQFAGMNPRRMSGIHWLNSSQRDHNRSRPPGVSTLLEEEEEDSVGVAKRGLQPRESQASPHNQEQMETYAEAMNELDKQRALLKSELETLNARKEELMVQESRIESKIDQLCDMEMLQEELAATRDGLANEREELIEMKETLEREKEAWQHQQEVFYRELKTKEESLYSELSIKESQLTLKLNELGLKEKQLEERMEDWKEQQNQLFMLEEENIVKQKDLAKTAQFSELEREKDQLEAKEVQLDVQAERLLQEKRIFEDEMQSAMLKAEQLKNDLDKRQREIEMSDERLVDDRNKLDAEKQAYLLEVKKLLEEKLAVQSKEEQLIEEVRNFSVQRESWQQEVESQETELKRKEQRFEQKWKDLEIKESQLEERLAFSPEVKDSLVDSQSQTEGLDSDWTALQQEKELLRKAQNELNTKQSCYNHELAELNERLATVTASEDAILEEKANLQFMREALAEERLSQQNHLEAGWRSQEKVMKERIDFLQEKVEQCRLREEELILKVSEHEKLCMCEEYKKEIARLTLCLDSLTNQKGELEQEVVRLKQRAAGETCCLEREHEISTLTVEELTQRNQVLEGRNKELETEVSSLESDLADTEEELENLQQQLRENEERERELVDTYNQRCDEFDKTVEQVEELNKLIAWGRGQLGEREKKISELDRITAELRITLTEKEGMLVEKDKQYKILENLYKSQETELIQKQDEVKSQSAEITSLNKKVLLLKESSQKDTDYFKKVIDKLKRSCNAGHNGSFLEEQKPEQTEMQIRKRLELEFSIKIKEFERLRLEKEEHIKKLANEVNALKDQIKTLQETRSSHSLRESNAQEEVSSRRPQNFAGQENIAPKSVGDKSDIQVIQKYEFLKSKYADLKKMYLNLKQDTESCDSIQYGGGAVENFKLLAMERQVYILQRKLDESTKEIEMLKKVNSSGN